MSLLCNILTTVILFLSITFSQSVRVTKVYENEDDRLNVLENEDENFERFVATNNLSRPHECLRTCIRGHSKRCYYKFYVEQYMVLGKACELCTPTRTNGCQCILADGVERSAYTINRMIPGPAIEVCEGDTVIIDLINRTPSSSLSIHWHGILQHQSQFYDGVPYVTQCPILPGNTFRYKWNAVDVGTHFWHSHSGLQKIDGVSGPIVIRQAISEDPNRNQYNYDNNNHVIFLQDWLHRYMNEQYPGRIVSNVGQSANNLLINGKGQYTNPVNNQTTNVPLEVFTVTAGNRYRFRMINALAGACPVQITVENHRLTVIAADGHPIQPVIVDTINSASAERFDFVINANQIRGSYWIHVKALDGCRSLSLHQVAMLNYTSPTNRPMTQRPTYLNGLPVGKVLNPLDANCNVEREDAICVAQLNATKRIEPDLEGNNVIKVILPFRLISYTTQDFYQPGSYENHFIAGGRVISTGSIDGIENKFPPSPLLSQYEYLNRSLFCNGDQNIQNCGQTCKCTHIIEIPYNSLIELIIIDEVGIPTIHHPFHLHGFAFRVMGVGKAPYPFLNMSTNVAIQLDQQNLLNRRFNYPPLKDTTMIPSNGYVVVRFRAANRGFWLLHCHILTHLSTGMSAILQVGSPYNMPKPPRDFPKCGNFMSYI